MQAQHKGEYSHSWVAKFKFKDAFCKSNSTILFRPKKAARVRGETWVSNSVYEYEIIQFRLSYSRMPIWVSSSKLSTKIKLRIYKRVSIKLTLQFFCLKAGGCLLNLAILLPCFVNLIIQIFIISNHIIFSYNVLGIWLFDLVDDRISAHFLNHAYECLE